MQFSIDGNVFSKKTIRHVPPLKDLQGVGEPNHEYQGLCIF